MERLKTLNPLDKPTFRATNIADFLGSRNQAVDGYAKWYEEARRARLLPRLYGPSHPSQRSVGEVQIPTVTYDPKRDRPDTFLELITFALQRITLFDPSGQLETDLLPASTLYLEKLITGIDDKIPSSNRIREIDWTSDVTLSYNFWKRFGRSRGRFILMGIENPHAGGGRPIPTAETRLRQIGLDIKR